MLDSAVFGNFFRRGGGAGCHDIRLDKFPGCGECPPVPSPSSTVNLIYVDVVHSHEAYHSNTVMIHNLCLLLSFNLCDLRWTRLPWGGLSSHLPSWTYQEKSQHPHYRWWYLWEWRDFLPYTGDPPTSSGHWCHEGWPIHGYRHHYKWWWWVFCNIIPTHTHTYSSATSNPFCIH